MPSKRVIVLERLGSKETVYGNQSPQYWSYVFWADVPVARASFYANAGLTSAVKDVAAGDLAALQAGTIVEKLDTIEVDKGATIPQLQTILEAKWTDYQAMVTNFNPWTRYGTYWDGTWHASGVV